MGLVDDDPRPAGSLAREQGLEPLLLAEEARRRGARELVLEVRADNPVAAALYRSEGFAEIGRRPRYYQPDDVDAIVMTLDLRAWAAAAASSAADAGVCT